jgi:hypothetical protein
MSNSTEHAHSTTTDADGAVQHAHSHAHAGDDPSIHEHFHAHKPYPGHETSSLGSVAGVPVPYIETIRQSPVPASLGSWRGVRGRLQAVLDDVRALNGEERSAAARHRNLAITNLEEALHRLDDATAEG